MLLPSKCSRNASDMVVYTFCVLMSASVIAQKAINRILIGSQTLMLPIYQARTVRFEQSLKGRPKSQRG